MLSLWYRFLERDRNVCMAHKADFLGRFVYHQFIIVLSHIYHIVGFGSHRSVWLLLRTGRVVWLEDEPRLGCPPSAADHLFWVADGLHFQVFGFIIILSYQFSWVFFSLSYVIIWFYWQKSQAKPCPRQQYALATILWNAQSYRHQMT